MTFKSWKTLSISGRAMNSLHTADGICLFKKSQVQDDILTFTAVDKTSTIQLTKVGTPYNVSLEYCIDSSAWTAFTPGSTIISLAAGQKACLRSTVEDPDGTINKFSKNSGDYYEFNMTGKIAASGNIQYLLDKTGKRENVHDYCYCDLFNRCSSMSAAPQLPATQLADHCYYSMFWSCASLTAAPELPATQLANHCYDSMFTFCTSLSAAPELPATQLANNCYDSMFYNCASLTAAPELPATQLADYCYYSMFTFCTSLSAAPELPATQLANHCYDSIFSFCTSLSAAPELPATQLANNCYDSIFSNCNKLSSIDVNFTDWSPSNATAGWANNVASTGTFTCPASLPLARGTSYIPSNWTIVRK